MMQQISGLELLLSVEYDTTIVIILVYYYVCILYIQDHSGRLPLAIKHQIWFGTHLMFDGCFDVRVAFTGHQFWCRAQIYGR